MKVCFLYISIIFAICGNAQPGKEASHWHFGQNCQLDFSSGSVIASPGICAVVEACADISDPNTGQLLFYTNGVGVSDKNGIVMMNGIGLFGHPSTTQGALIVPMPDSVGLYYIVTADAQAGPKGVRYSIVDLNLNNGLGKVTVKNKLLTPAPTTEKVTALRHCNGVDYWIITHPYNSDAFNAYLVSATGLDTIPVISHSGTIHKYISPYNDETAGYMKVSPNGKKLALGISSDSLPILEIFDIDNSTGIINNPITINFSGVQGPYGVTFSPDNSKLYASTANADSNYIFQYDLSSGIPSSIINSQTLLIKKKFNMNTFAGYLGAMQMAPDGKIYICKYEIDTLAVINNPNNLGVSCNLQWNGLSLPAFYWGTNGLPNFIDANYAGIQIDISDIKQCGAFLSDTLDAGVGYANYYWSTGAGTQTIVVHNPGTYWVTVTNGQGCTRTDSMHAYLITPGKQIVSACVADTLNTAQSIVLSYSWSDGTTNPVKTFTNSGIFWEDVSFVGGCTVRDSFIVNIDPNPAVNLGVDTSFCKGNLRLNAYYPSSTYLWNTTETGPIITANKPGIYFVTVTTQFGCKNSDTLVVKADPEAFNFKMPNVVTPNNDNINDAIDFGSLQFSALQIQIYNRWGQVVFESGDPEAIWKPTNNDGTYFYTANYRIDCGADSETKNIKGYITVVR